MQGEQIPEIHSLQMLQLCCQCNTKCDAIKQNQSEVGNIDFKIQPNKAENVLCFLFFFGILQLLLSLEPIEQF